MNSFTLMAQIVQAPQLRYTSDNQTPVADMLVQFAGLQDEDPPETLKVVGWNALAQEIQVNYHQGDRVVLEGYLTATVIDRPEGFKEKKVEMAVQRIHQIDARPAAPVDVSAAPVAATKTRKSKAPTKATVPVSASAPSAGTATPGVDDEIPF